MADDKYLEGLYNDLDYSQTEFDKSLTFISSGLLAGSFAFIDKIVKIEHAAYKGFLLFGWVLLAIAIGLATYCHLQSTKHISNAIEIYKKNDDENQKQVRLASIRTINHINLGTIIVIILGALSIFLFIYLNFYPITCK